ncbi:MAG TPA: hypothetical protein VLL25_11020 [Acidimicrobiales bacterium]|nr:hypothetical protein [Acidimicrobiales bacterium]
MRAKDPSTTTVNDDDRCTLCGYRSDGSFADRLRHLRRSHPDYARGLLLRLVAPLVLVAMVGLLAAVHAPAWGYVAALVVAAGVVAGGVVIARRDPNRTSRRPGLGQLLRSGGLRFVLFGVAAVAILIISRH